MSTEDFRNALLKGEKMNDFDELTARVLRRDRRWMWFLAIACVVTWMLVVMLPWGTTLPLLAKIADHRAELVNNNAPHPGDETLFEMQVRHAVIATFLCSVASMFAAAVCTVAYIAVSRRATMRQMSLQLAEISAQLKLIGGQKS